MPAIKKITETIAEDMRAKYEAGESTQAELADLFNVSVPTVNKTVKGVKPAKRKYKTNPAKGVRDAALVAEYDPDNGVGMKELAVKYEMTYQNVSLILQSAGLSPRQNYFTKLKAGAVVRAESVAAEKVAKKTAKATKISMLSELLKSGCKIEEFRKAAGLKSCNAAQVKIVHLRKKYGLEMFPKRSNRVALSPEEIEAKLMELSAAYKADPKNHSALAAVFAEKESSVLRRISLARTNREDGESLFPRQRSKKSVTVEAAPVVEEVEEEKTIEEVVEDFASVDLEEIVEGVVEAE